MKKNLMLLMFIFPILVSAQLQWQNGGVPVRLGDNINYDIFSTSQDDNTFVNVWSDTRNGIRGIFAQKVDSSGNKLWDQNDVEIFNPNRRQIVSNTIATSDNCTIICWKDYVNEDTVSDLCRIQKIDADGNMLWGAVGIVLENCDANYFDCNLVAHSDGGFYLFWTNTIQSMIKGVRILPDGSFAEGWYIGKNILGTYGNYHVNSDLEDGVVLASISGDDVYIQRVQEDGNLLWGTLGTIIQNGEAVDQTEICTDEPGTYYCTWQKEFTPDDNELLISKIDENGESAWDEHLEVPIESLFYSFNSACSDSELVVAINYLESIRAHKISPDGEFLWGDSGISIVENNPEVISNKFGLKVDALENAVVTWSENVEYDNKYNYKIQRLNSAGEKLFGEFGLEIFPPQYVTFKTTLALSEQNYYLIRIEKEEQSEQVIQEILDLSGNSVIDSENIVLKENLTGKCGYFSEIMENGDNPVLAWSDKRSGKDRIYMQTLDSDGNSLLAENGVPITPYESYYQWEVDTAGNSAAGLFAFSWSEVKGDYQRIYTQAVDQFGNRIWADSSVCVSSSNYYSSDSKIEYFNNDGIDEYYIGWKSYDTTYQCELNTQKIVDGIPQWSENGVVISQPVDNLELFDIKNNFFIWGDLSWPDLDLRITLMQPDGTLAEGWPENGLMVADGLENNSDIKSSITAEGLLVTWIVNGESYNEIVYGQLIDYEGNKLWGENGKVLVPATTNSYYDIVVDEHIYIAWDLASSATQMNFYIQKYDLSGNALWDEDGMQFTSYTEENHWVQKLELSLIEDGVVGVLQYHWPEGVTRIDAVHINSEGELIPYDNAIEICDYYKYQTNPQVCTSGNNAYISWLDARSTSDSDYGLIFEYGVYAQKLTIDSSSGDNETISLNSIQLMNNYPNPFNPNTNINFSLPNDSDVELSIFNIKGQKVNTLCKNKLEKGEHNFIWNGTDKNQNAVSSGIYFYKLKTDAKEITKRMVLIK